MQLLRFLWDDSASGSVHAICGTDHYAIKAGRLESGREYFRVHWWRIDVVPYLSDSPFYGSWEAAECAANYYKLVGIWLPVEDAAEAGAELAVARNPCVYASCATAGCMSAFRTSGLSPVMCRCGTVYAPDPWDGWRQPVVIS